MNCSGVLKPAALALRESLLCMVGEQVNEIRPAVTLQRNARCPGVGVMVMRYPFFMGLQDAISPTGRNQ
jgi:hypothetical protein